MNWKRGLFRAWLVLSAAWTIYIFVTVLESINAANYTSAFEVWRDPVLYMLAPWAITAAAIVLLWSLRGFRSN